MQIAFSEESIDVSCDVYAASERGRMATMTVQ